MPLTDAEMARRLDCDPSLVKRYRERGMPMHSAAAARAWKKANVRARVAPPHKRPPEDEGADAPEIKPSGYMDARTSRERAEAEAAQIRVLEARGRLVDLEKVRAEVARHLSGLRDSLLQIPSRLQSVLAAETDEVKVHDLLQDELYQALAAVAEVEG